MEQSILENSKGATYMSFVLDIEIVIKTNKEKINLAERTTKNQVSKKKNENTKDSPALGRDQNVNVYAMTSQPSNIFALALNQSQGKSMDDTEAMVKEILNNMIDLCEKKYPGKTVLNKNLRQLLRKKKIDNDEKTAKVFKGKVEAIDFLECNRIFMCNYLKMPMQFINKTTKKSKGNLSFKVETQSEYKTETEKLKHCTEIKQQRKSFKLWKPNVSRMCNLSKTFQQQYSSGDQRFEPLGCKVQVLETSKDTEPKPAPKKYLPKMSVLKCHENVIETLPKTNIKTLNYSYSLDNIIHKSLYISQPNVKINSIPDLRKSNRECRLLDQPGTSKCKASIHRLSDLGIIFCNSLHKQATSSEEIRSREKEVIYHKAENNDITTDNISRTWQSKTNISKDSKLDHINKNHPKLGIPNVSKNEEEIKTQSDIQFNGSSIHLFRKPLWRKFPKFMKSFNVS